MNKVLLDTDILSEILKDRNRQVAQRAELYHQQFGRFTFSSITVMEVIKGFRQARQSDRIFRFLTNLVDDEVLAFDVDAASIAGEIYGELERTGQSIGRADPMIAAIALQHDLVLATANTKHFQRIADLGYSLSLENWRE
ncbi:MAG: PIN domain-containing protein [Pirellulales bacterium]|nr:PIN domain-containing protein [Pirellulales bacterium]